ncbi:transmembrane protein 231 [Aricia agestis]|uniref:transmembrane protein 231 n=1 Tax=Aricia agestis TaxID=91739 RepID=UPI001C2015DC|nr:transmembrane protein 231 [Aricia agestis]
MALYKLFGNKIEIQYKSYLMSKATLFIIVTSLLNIVLPFIIAYRSRGFWLKSHYFYEQPTVRATYEYLLIAETDDPSVTVVCGDHKDLPQDKEAEENCSEVQIQEWDANDDGKNDKIEFKFKLNLMPERYVVSLNLFIGLDFQIMSTCSLQMHSLGIVSKEFAVPANEVNMYGDLQFYQSTHLSCLHNVIDAKYNVSLFEHQSPANNQNIIRNIYEDYVRREASTKISNIFIKTENGHTGSLNIDVRLRIAEMKFRYQPSILQELKWAWPQYLSIAVIFYWILNRIKVFVFKNRLLMAWEIVPYSKKL